MSVKHGVTRVFGGSFVSFYEINVETEDRLKLGLYFEGGPPPDIADRINASFPNYLQKPLHQRIVEDIAKDDKSVHEKFPDSSPPSKGSVRQRNAGRTPPRWFPAQHGRRRLWVPLARVGQGRWILLRCGFHGTAFLICHRTQIPPPTVYAKHRCRREPADNRWED